MNLARLCLLCVLLPMLGCTPNFKQAPIAYAPPKIDCAIFEPPANSWPAVPALTEKSVVVWQMYGLAMQEYANGVLGQRFDSAVCVKDLKDKRVIR